MSDDNPIDEVMRRCIEDPTLLGPEDIDTIISYYRNSKQQYDSGVKIPKRASAKMDLDAPVLTLESLGMKKTPTIKLRRPNL
jgi:hypothetical protein